MLMNNGMNNDFSCKIERMSTTIENIMDCVTVVVYMEKSKNNKL